MISLNSYNSLFNHGLVSVADGGHPVFSENNFELSPADVVFVSARQCSRVILERTFIGFGSLRELIAVVGSYIGSATGLVTLHFRNRDRGCSTRRAVRFRPSESLFASA
ncbi:MAG: hypothetical protein HDS68_05855 [Bacteroidales bacterium]|nr:hypothetical protein [Bacteroidales bacterium]